MKRRVANVVIVALSAPTFAACDIFYLARAHVPLVAPMDTSCLRLNARDGGYPKERSVRAAEGRTTAVAYYDARGGVTQVVQRDSSVFRGTVYRDSSVALHTAYVQINRPIDPRRGASMTAEMANYLLDMRDACGGRSPGNERLFSVDVGDVYRAWVVEGTGGRVAVRLTADSVRYRLLWPTNADRHVLRLDTLTRDTTPHFPRWITVDSLVLPVPPRGVTIATNCWRGDSIPTGDLIALTRATAAQYWEHASAAWSIDRSALRIRRSAIEDVECLNEDWPATTPRAPPLLRAAALSFRPSPGMSRLYALLSKPDFPSTATAAIAVDGQVVGQLDGGSFLMVEIEPGQHHVSAPTGGNASTLLLDAAPDSAYFLDLRRAVFAWRWRVNLRMMDPGRARERIRQAHMTSSSWRARR
jgi:hypothetical protein